jgi:RNA polymerase sigma factor (TIGR02999 family)
MRGTLLRGPEFPEEEESEPQPMVEGQPAIFEPITIESVAAEITSLLARWNKGDPDALNELMPLVYPRLRAIAGSVFRGSRDSTTLQPTALVHETYLRFLKQNLVGMADREHFYCFAAQCMRRILVSHFRTRVAQKRGGVAAHVPLHDELPWITVGGEQMLEVNEALDELREVDERKVRLIELCYFLGCSADETAEVSKLSNATVNRELRVARAWLF